MQKSIRFRGESLEYEIKGSGIPVMLVHGFTEDRRIWEPLLSGMENKYKWILPDLPGSGRSAYNKSLPEIKDFAEVLHAITANENISKMVLIGHSMGGYISLAFTEKYPDKISALGLFHSSSYTDSVEKKKPGIRISFSSKRMGAVSSWNREYPDCFLKILNPVIRKKFAD